MKCQAGWITSWNQDCWQKYQQPQICSWYHSNGRKWRGTKEHLDEMKEESEKVGLKSTFMASSPIISWQQMGKQWKQCQTLFFWAPKSLQMVTAAMKLKDMCSLEESYDQPRQHLKKQRHYFTNKSLSSQGYGFSSSHVWMWELDCKESWAPKNWCFWTVVLEKTLRVPWTARRSN